jgi:UDP-N-acetylmuramate--alanine ligase
MVLAKHKQLHFIGIGGAGMSAIARVALEMGYKVTGSDIKESITTIRLKDMGAKIDLGHKISFIKKAHVVIISTAIPEDDPELQYARQERLTILHRAEMLNVLMEAFPKRVSVAGTHGKTTTSSMVAKVLYDDRQHPTYLVGAELKDLGTNAGLGDGNYFVAESDESDGSFLHLTPNIAIITNIEADHLDYYKDEESVKAHFKTFLDRVIEKEGYLILNRDNPILAEFGQAYPNQVVWFGFSDEAEVQARNITFNESGTAFELWINGKSKGSVTLKVFGNHNVSNALGVLAFAFKENIALNTAKKSLAGFSGTKRRFQWIGKEDQVDVYDDYGHHPTEILTTLDGIKKSFPTRRLICIFQPHRYTRTRDFIEEFPQSFPSADWTVITEVYSANEPKIEKISGNTIVEKMKAAGQENVLFVAKKGDIPTQILPMLQPNDLVVTMGAGDIYSVGKEILTLLKKRHAG